MKNHAVFFDRDGTLNEDPGYLGNPDEVKLLEGTGEALSNLKRKYNFKLIVISNQSGIARGLLKKEDVDAVNKKLNELLMPYKTSIDAFYYCPAHPDYNTDDECSCRKPSPELVFKASKEHNIELDKSYFVGDAVSDIECGINAGLKTVLVRTGYGNESFFSLQKQKKFPSFVAQNILDAYNFIINDYGKQLIGN